MADKAPGAFLTIGELSAELGVPQHILRYWETRFPKLKPLTRAGNRRYYRPEDVALVRRIHQLLDVEGYTVKGVQKLLSAKTSAAEQAPVAEPAIPIPAHNQVAAPLAPPAPPVAAPAPSPIPSYIPDLVLIRDRLKVALAAERG
ncbi:MAG: MerR family transcriptional regulator [Alphaproteobacteria bacterium]|jgi:DNA-binding transcriptional MerR regulator|nr:MerR family transcriptional regulator [Alphaproteobacteria bacterium]